MQSSWLIRLSAWTTSAIRFYDLEVEVLMITHICEICDKIGRSDKGSYETSLDGDCEEG